MRWWTGLGLVAGCVPADGVFLSALEQPEPSGQVLRLGERPLAEDATLALQVELDDVDAVWGYRLVSDDPAVLDVAPVDAVLDQDVPLERCPSDQALWVTAGQGGAGTASVLLQSGRAGLATLSLVDEATDEIVEQLELEVAPAVDAQLVLLGATRWQTMAGLPPRSVAGSAVSYVVTRRDALGRPLAEDLDPMLILGGDSFDDFEIGPSDTETREVAQLAPPGRHAVAGAPVPLGYEVVPEDRIVSLALREHVAAADLPSELLVVGLDAAGQPVRGLMAAWDTAPNPGDRGDLYLYHHDDAVAAAPVTARWHGLEVTGWVQQAGDAEVRQGDNTVSCSTAGGPAGGAALALGLLLALTRRSSAAPCR
ncbi:MAG: hypothetical protein R3F59_02355 [Myxococcota bacterium]